MAKEVKPAPTRADFFAVTTSVLGWTAKEGWRTSGTSVTEAPDLVLYFGCADLLTTEDSPLRELRERYPRAVLAGCSTAGEIVQGSVREHSLVALCVRFEASRVRGAIAAVETAEHSFEVAAELGRRLSAPDLSHVLVLSDGLVVSGTPLTRGFQSTLPPGVSVTGGLAGDSARFVRTLVGLDGDIGANRVAALGFYGSRLKVAFGSAGGWEAFGPRRLVTKSAGNILYGLDGQPALALYKRYLGDRAAGLPATGFHFPLLLLSARDSEEGLVRSPLAVDEAQQSLTFAGDLPEGRYVRLMKARHAALVGGAGSAAQAAADGLASTPPGFVVMVSCIGRRIVMGLRADDELEAVLSRLGPQTAAAGFYSYGEICPSRAAPCCDLHNQTMTLTAFSELPA